MYYLHAVNYRLVPGKRPRALAAQAPKKKVGSYTEKELKWFNYPRTRAYPECEVSCQRVRNRLASSLIRGSSKTARQ